MSVTNERLVASWERDMTGALPNDAANKLRLKATDGDLVSGKARETVAVESLRSAHFARHEASPARFLTTLQSSIASGLWYGYGDCWARP